MSAESETRCRIEEVERWIAEAHGGGRAALNRLLELCLPSLLSAANKEIGAALRVRVSPADLVQNTLLEAYRDFPCFHGRTEEDWLGWLQKVLLHNLANEIRRHIQTAKRSIYREVHLAEVASAALPDKRLDGTDSSDARAQSGERSEALTQALKELPEHFSQALVLHTCEGLTFAQVGDRLCCSSEAARKLWGRAAEKLRRLLGGAR